MPYYSIFSNICSTCKTESELFTEHLPKTGNTYSYLCNLCNNEINISNANVGIEVDCLPKNAVVIKPKTHI